MALTKVGKEGITGVSNSSDATAITIDSSEKVGIGTTSGTGKLTVQDSSLPKIQANYQGTHHLELGVGGSGCGFAMTTGHFMTFNHQPVANAGSDTNLTERMRIDSTGAVMVGTTNNDVASSSGTGNEGHVLPAGSPAQHAFSNSTCLDLNRKTTDGVIINLRKNGSSVGSISTNANSLPSDKNFKRDIKDLNIGLDLVSQLQPKSFNLIVDDENSPVMYGLVAQDLEIALEKVGVTKNSAWILQHEEKNDAKESDYSLDYGKLIPILINAIKELQAKVTALESK